MEMVPPPMNAAEVDNTGWPVIDEQSDEFAARFEDEHSIEL
jgi:hypothetical protein